MYFFWWLKPQEVSEPIQVVQRKEASDTPFSVSVHMVSVLNPFILDELINSSADGHTDLLTAVVLAFPASGLQLLAWTGHFPSAAEKCIWRISSIAIGVAPIYLYTHFVIWRYTVTPTWVSRINDPIYGWVQELFGDRFPPAPQRNRTISRSRD